MSTPTPGQGEGLLSAGHDSSFDSFIDSNLILDSHSPAPTPPPPSKTTREAAKERVVPLSALPSRLTTEGGDQSGLNSSSGQEFVNFSHTSSSTVTTPTTSNSSSLHNLNFDFFDGHANGPGTSIPPHFSAGTEVQHAGGNGEIVSAFGNDAAMLSPTMNPTSASSHAFSWNAANSFLPMPMTHTLTRSVDDMGHSAGHHAAHHHQRSLSLRDVAPPSDAISIESLTALPFPSVKMEQDQNGVFATNFGDNVPSPMTEDRSSPSSSAVSSSLFDQGSPRLEKKRRLASPSESLGSSHSAKSTKSAAMARSSTSSGNGKKSSGSNRRSRASTMNSKAAAPATTSLGFSASSLIENIAASAPTMMEAPAASLDQMMAPPTASSPAQQHAQQPSFAAPHMTPAASMGGSEGMVHSHGMQDGSPADQSAASMQAKLGNKRPPPSASQVTESGQPFPIIDTSAKHSSLFVPPDTSGLTKREARLVKNRAAAFLSRQRKREQFEELEIKCKSLCRLVWRFWEIVSGPDHDVEFAEKYSQTRILPIVLGEEAEDVKEVLEMVVALKGGSVAPTEDGQLQGAVAAGISSANGKIIPNANTNANANATVTPPAHAQKAAAAAPAVGAVQMDTNDLAVLRAELDESKKRENALRAELAQERSMRLDESYHRDMTKPFKGGKQGEALSLTISPKYDGNDEEEEEEEDRGRLGEPAAPRRRGAARSSIRSGPPRTSERLQRQQSQLALTSASAAANGGQRKAAGAALMMVLFSFALFGLPSGQMSRVGGITRAGSTDDFSVGKVLGAPLSGTQYGQDDDEDMMDFDMTCKQAPSSHLSAKDLLPPMPDMSDLLNLEDTHHDDDEDAHRSYSITRSFRDVLGGEEDGSVDYKAFAKDLGASLDWDVQRGFIVLGTDEEEDSKSKENETAGEGEGRAKEKEDGGSDAPTKLTLFVPAPDMSGEVMDAEDRFYDAPLASADAAAPITSSSVPLFAEGTSEQDSRPSSQGKDMTQAEATRAALRVLRNHRIAQEAAALATSRRLGKKPSPSQRVAPPHSGAQRQPQQPSRRRQGCSSNGDSKTPTGDDCEESGANANRDFEADEEQDFSKDVMDATNPADKIRGTDFYQLEFSLSGAKVRNVAELAKLLGVVRNKKE